MRIPYFPALAALSLLAGCTAPPPPAAPATPQIANSVSGTIMLREPRELSTQAQVDLKVIDVAQPATPLAQTVIANASRPPIAFNLPIDPAQVDPKRTYAVEAVLTDGVRRYLPVLQYPVLTRNAPSKVDIIVAPEPTPGEKMFEAYKKALAQIGSLKSISGSGETATSTTAWDAFISNGKIKVVRETTSLYDDKANETGRVSMKMAFQNDKPWVVVKEESSGEGARPYATTRVGWDDSGALVLKEKLASGQHGEALADEAKAIYDHAQQAFNMAQARVPKK
jgi:putative lipoprotein